jgi:hypothetical protein
MDYALDSWVSMPNRKEIFFYSRPALRPTQPPIKWVLWEVKQLGGESDHLHLRSSIMALHLSYPIHLHGLVTLPFLTFMKRKLWKQPNKKEGLIYLVLIWITPIFFNIPVCFIENQDSSVTELTGYKLHDYIPPCQGQGYSCENIWTISGAHTAYYQLLTEVSFPRVKEVRHEAHYSLPSCAEVKNTWGFTPTPPWHVLWYRDTFFWFTNV